SDGPNILDTGGGILNMINLSNEADFITFNPDTVWSQNYKKYIEDMEKFYFLNKVQNILLLANENLSFDKNLKGDFNLEKNIIKKNEFNSLIYTGCQIFNKSLFNSYKINNFSIMNIWNKLINKDELYGFESLEDFKHITDLNIYKQLLKN
ncbi:nucleotidyltransferase family protein, partial [Candidatus Pelagibacter sp.]|nr:nucleotidyltransferase family protein [Candidatus Pelagibacter sp.]